MGSEELMKVPLKRTIAYEADRWGRAIGVALLFVAILFLRAAFLDWANSLHPEWLSFAAKLLTVVLVAVAIGALLLRAPQRF
jgi:hypothetical protein